jgi:hypothetical protein
MDQRIFHLGLSVEATSLYILVDSLSETGTPINRRACQTLWNSGPEELDRAAAELVERGVMEKDQAGNWRLVPPGDWPQAPDPWAAGS